MSFFKHLIFVCVILGLSVQVLISQQRYSNPEEFSIVNGLSNNEVRCLLKDAKGYLWVGTLYGLAKYDGNKFTIYKHEPNSNGISGDVITAIYEDSKGNILVGSNGLSVLQRQTGKWKNFLHNPDNPFSISNPGVSCIEQENDSIYWIVTYSGIDRFNMNTGVFKRLNFHPSSRILSSRIMEIVPGKSISINISSNIYQYNLATGTFRVFPLNSAYNKNTIDVFNNRIVAVRKNGPGNYLLVGLDLPSAEEVPVIQLKDDNCSLFHDKFNLFLICKDALYVFDKSFKLVDHIFFQTQAIQSNSRIEYFCGLKELNGTIWVGTSNGLYKIPGPSPFHVIDNRSGLQNCYIRSLAVDRDNNIWAGVRQGPVYRIPISNLSKNKLNGIVAIRYPGDNGDMYTTNKILELNDHDFLFVTPNSLYHYCTRKGQFTDQFQIKDNNQYFSALEIPGGILIGSLEKPTLFKILVRSGKIFMDSSFKIRNAPDVVYSIFKDGSNQVWIGGEGLYKLIFPKGSNEAILEPVIPPVNKMNFTNNSVWNILEIDPQRLLVCTTTNGFYVYHKVTGTYQHFNKKNGLPTDFTCAVLEDSKHNYWMSTKEGLSFIDSKNFSIVNYTVKNGAFNCDFNFKCCAKTNENELFFGSKQGIVMFKPDSIRTDKTTYPLLINEFRIFDDVVRQELSDKDTIVLKHDENFFSFEFSLLDFRNPKEICYKYQLLKFDKTARLISDGTNSVSYTDVPPGKYRFLLSAYNQADTANQKKIEVLVNIEPAFYQTKVFKIVIVFILISILGSILLLYIRRQVLRGKLYKMELDLLRAQINPHFIFNTLTSIQHSILLNTKNVAIDYLSRFSRLMRMCLDYSRMDYIVLEKALNFYLTYVSVESLNLDEEIDFTVHVDEGIDTGKLEISPMLIQPFIENAIVHGLSPKNKDMQIKLSIGKAKDILICTVEDNGIGRVKASEIAKKKANAHQSMGIEISWKSILLQLKGKKGAKDFVKITDNYDEEGKPTGTTVCLKIPFRIK